VKNALSYSISLMTGAPQRKNVRGLDISSIAERLELSVVLAAPTGKAAKRLEEVVGHDASTVHRLLGFNGHTYSRDALNPIEADILVIDEVSMVDVRSPGGCFKPSTARRPPWFWWVITQLPPVVRDLLRIS